MSAPSHTAATAVPTIPDGARAAEEVAGVAVETGVDWLLTEPQPELTRATAARSSDA